MNPDLQNKIDSEAKIGNTDGYGLHSFADEQRISEFKRGASFVQGILQAEIESKKKQVLILMNQIVENGKREHEVTEMNVEFISALSEANTTIQSLKDENKKFREAVKDFLDCSGDINQSDPRLNWLREALTQKAEE